MADAQPVEGGAGFEFVLELGNEVLAVQELKSRILHTKMVARGEDRLEIHWSPK